MSNYTFCVITKVPDPQKGEGGNMACPMGELCRAVPGDVMKVEPISPLITLELRSPVFTAGEVLILDSECGREVCGLERKPSKWDVEVEHFTDIGKAVERARAIPSASYSEEGIIP